MITRRRGVGADSSFSRFWSGPCSLLSGGVFKQECWCLDYPSLCSNEEYQASVAAVYPDKVYAPVQPLSPPPAPGPGVPSLDEILARQREVWRMQGRETMDKTAANLDEIGDEYDATVNAPKTNWWLWIGAAIAGVFALSTLTAPGPRRYGR